MTALVSATNTDYTGNAWYKVDPPYNLLRPFNSLAPWHKYKIHPLIWTEHS